MASRLTQILRLAAGGLATLLVLTLIAGLYLYKVSASLPDIGTEPTSFRAARTSVVYAADGSVLAEWHGEQDRTYVELESIPPVMQQAVVAIEDERFYEHTGVDLEAVGRALRVNAEAGGYEQGGSTITQQVVKLLFTDGERSIDRKVREALLAFELDTRAGKDEVLETYLNLVYFGEGAYGVEAAAQQYFGKSASTLSLSESALLAGVIQAPSRYSPRKDLEGARRRRDVVLGKMLELGLIDATQEAEARAAEIALAVPAEAPYVAPYFVEYVKQSLIEELGAKAVYEGGLRVYTTLDPALQAYAEGAARALLKEPDDPSVALVCIDHSTGEVLAMVGGKDFAKDQFNLAVQGRRQPGSAFKPFVLVTALSKGVKPTDQFSAAPYEVKVTDGVWKVQNYENTVTGGSLTLTAATSWSVNAVYARLIMKVGPSNVVDIAHKMGITSELEAHPAIALGGLTTGVSPLEMASAYGTIAADGVHANPVAVLKVTDDQDVEVWAPDRSSERVLDKAVARQASAMLHEVVEKGTGQAARFGSWAAGKTGTTQQYRDAWFVGYSGRLVTAVWVGYPEGQIPMTDVHGIRVTGGSFPASIWKRFMEKAVPRTNSSASVPPATSQPLDAAPAGPVDQREYTICVDSFKLAKPTCPNTVVIYLDASSAPAESCTQH